MSRIHSDRLVRFGTLALTATLLAAGATSAQEPAATDGVRLISSEVSVSRGEAVLNLELSDGRALSYAVRDGNAVVNGDVLGSAPRGGPLDDSWRALLAQAMDARSDELPGLLMAWEARGGGDVGEALDRALERALADVQAVQAPTAPDAPGAAGAPLAPPAPGLSHDSVTRLNERIAELQEELAEMEERDWGRRDRDRGFFSRTFGHVGRGIAGIISLLVSYAVLFGIAFATIVLGGRKFIEGVGDTARNATVRSGLVGLAATFLVVPAFVLGILALVISIVGIPALLVFVPLFPLAVVVALLLGYLGVAHAAGEAFAERRYSGEEWYQRGNSYYFPLADLGLLLVLFLGAHILEMTPFLGILQGLLTFLGVVLTWAALTIGFGAVLISRGGTRPVSDSAFGSSSTFAGDSDV